MTRTRRTPPLSFADRLRAKTGEFTKSFEGVFDDGDVELPAPNPELKARLRRQERKAKEEAKRFHAMLLKEAEHNNACGIRMAVVEIYRGAYVTSASIRSLSVVGHLKKLLRADGLDVDDKLNLQPVLVRENKRPRDNVVSHLFVVRW